MKNKSLKKLSLISSNAIRQVLVSLFGLIIPFLVIHFSDKEIWGSFVSILLFSLLVLQFINWGNKEYLLRKFSEQPNKIGAAFSENMTTRFPLVVIFSITGFLFFPIQFGFWIVIWLVGRFLNHSVEALILFQKEFDKSIVIEVGSFIIFGVSFYFLKAKIDVYSLLIIYSSYQFFKGFFYFIIFKKFFLLQKSVFKIDYFKSSFPFFLLSILGFLASKIDVYIIENIGNNTITAEYQIINSLLVFTMSITVFIYAPFTKMLYRNTDNVIEKSQKALATIGLVIVPVALFVISIILKYYIKTNFGFIFFLIAFMYVYPSYVYGLDIVNLFKQHQEKTVVRNLLLGVITNTLLSSLFLYLDYSIVGVLFGSALAQVLVLILFKFKNIVS
ncbi:polysaccharide biosynthesis protein [Flavobacterium capsici]|uniref:Uncharacterized protein n=1 Tax=Flavobacterium capsici TaxID=3075618 RepID=A0AA96EY26_9FLAO|nr:MULTISPECIES: hypothetical protein [unclassified Flavobacterium]WNM19374.1 hypothetical protein RN608_01525 [Flavobacterium sp. PMR2A8]WNM20763.1 hypothetical protein RN605_08695 [Flavobacterium sp. PMTSA4]